MLKRMLLAPLIAALVLSFWSRASSTGSLSFYISLAPQATVGEEAPFDIGLQMELNLKLTLSGLEFSLASIFGITGVEHAVFELEAQLGVLSVRNELSSPRLSATGHRL